MKKDRIQLLKTTTMRLERAKVIKKESENASTKKEA